MYNLKTIIMKTKTLRFEKDPYNKVQNFLYNRALYGLNMYSKEEIAELSKPQKVRILKIQRKTQKVLNLWKQEITNGIANEIFIRLFPDMEITKCLVNFYGIEGDERHINMISFKDLNINKEHIITKLITSKVLPKHFRELKIDMDYDKKQKKVMQ